MQKQTLSNTMFIFLQSVQLFVRIFLNFYLFVWICANLKRFVYFYNPSALSMQALRCQGMLQLAQYILGVEIVLTLQHLHDLQYEFLSSFSVPIIQAGSRSSSKKTQTLAAMLLPRDAELYVMYRDVNDGMFVRTAASDSIFMLQKHWQQLANVLPQDSVCRVVAYKNNKGNLMLGVYDLLRVSGDDLHQNAVFERQQCLYSLFSKNNAGPSIVPHWVGEEGCLLKHLQNKHFVDALPFKIDNMVCIDVQADNIDAYKVVLKPLLID